MCFYSAHGGRWPQPRRASSCANFSPKSDEVTVEESNASPSNQKRFDGSPPSVVNSSIAVKPPHRLRQVQYEAQFFQIDVSVCPACGHKMRIIAFITDPASVRRYLKGEGLPTEAPLIAPASAPPQMELEY